MNESTESKSDDEEEEFTESKIKEGLQLGEKLADFFLKHDPSIERAVSFKNDLKYCLFRYAELVKRDQNDQTEKDTQVDTNDESSDGKGSCDSRKRKRC